MTTSFKFLRSTLASAMVASAFMAQASAATAPLDLVAPLSDYKIYVAENLQTLVTDTRAFTEALKAGDLALARKLFGPTRMAYERIEPVAELFDDLDKSIDSRADDHEKKEKSADFTGFHRIEYSLFAQNTAKGLAPLADKLMADVNELQKRVQGLTFPPEKVVGGAATLMEEVARTKISGEEDRYSHTDLYDFQANFEGAKKIVDLLNPIVVKDNKAFVDKTNANFATVLATLAKYKTADGGFETYAKLTARDRKLLSGKVNTLAEDLSKLRGMLGLN
ncbi:MAG: EfeM/EfeO family lipoprotein [Rhodoferax sp.]|nr:EfeM/EfeO family lipoprotein [Rhodoferax sp.]